MAARSAHDRYLGLFRIARTGHAPQVLLHDSRPCDSFAGCAGRRYSFFYDAIIRHDANFFLTASAYHLGIGAIVGRMRAMGAGDVDACQKRSNGIDTVRGLLVVAVIFGHFAELSDRAGFLAWLGSGFRMPLFIGLSGYLFGLEHARAIPLTQLLRRYYGRLLLPWLVALAVYLTVTQEMTLLTPFRTVIRPPYHFWFVPVMMAFALLAATSRKTPAEMLGIAIPVSIAAMYVFGVGYGTEQTHAWMPDRRFFTCAIYFFYGLWVARRPADPWKAVAACVLAPIGMIWWCELYRTPNLNAEVAAALMASMSLICLLPYARVLPVTLPTVASVGRNSLFYYLWHPMIFGMWSSYGLGGIPLLLLTLATLLVAGRLFLNASSVACILGLTSGRKGAEPIVHDPLNVPVLPLPAREGSA
jgi:acyltransferase